MSKIIKVYCKEEDFGVYENYNFMVDGVVIGCASVIFDDRSAYVERIDIEEEYRNHGYGTEFLKALSGKYGEIYLAPDNEDAQRLYERIGFDYNGGDYDYIDQGFGVYRI